MSIHTVASRDFARDVGHAKRLTADGPVFITDRGKPAFALLKIEDYYQLSGGQQETSLLSFMHGDDVPRTDGIAYEAPRIHIELKPASEDAGES